MPKRNFVAIVIMTAALTVAAFQVAQPPMLVDHISQPLLTAEAR